MVTIDVTAGDEVTTSDRLATIEAMRMESAVTGTIQRVAVPNGTSVEPGDLLLVLDPS